MDDQELIRRCTLGEAEAWQELVRRHVPLLFAAVARTVGPAEAEDVLQGLFLKLWEDGRRRLRTFQGKSRLSTWLVAVAHREAVDHARSSGARDRLRAAPASVLAVLNGHAPATDGSAASREAEAAVHAALGRLPARDRLLVRLVYLDECPYREVARLLAVPENSISPWLVRARGRLEALLRRDGGGTPSPRTDPAREPL